MTTRKPLQCRLIFGFMILSVCLTLMHAPAYPQTYIAGQLGVSIPGSLSDIDVTSATLAGGIPTPAGTKLSDQDLHNSFLFGAKVGYFSRTVRWFGVEGELFHTTPHIKQQPLTISSPPPGGSFTADAPGLNFRVITLAPLNLIARYPGHRLQPYVAIGPGIFIARIRDPGSGDSQSSTKLGLNTQLGLRYFVNRHVALFGEYKFNYVRLDFKETSFLEGIDATYMAHNFVFGIGYHF